MFAQHIVGCTHYEPDFDALRSGLDADRHGRGRRVRRRDGEPRRVRRRRATRRQTVVFPSDHGGFLGGEYGQPGEPRAFAAKLREVLEEA